MKVSIIGGGGLVGSSAAFALQCGGIVSHINLIDLNADQARGQALDLLHGASLVADQRIRATGYEAIPESDIVIITAGLRRKPDEPRLALINRNVDLFLDILAQASVGRAEARRHRPRRLQSRRRADLSRRQAARSARRPGDRAGNPARYSAVPKLDRRSSRPSSHPGLGPDPGRARRQHGADLVGRAGRRLAARAIPEVERGACRVAHQANARQRGRGDLA